MSGLLSIRELNYMVNGKQIIDNLSVSMEQGEIAGLMGPVGAGKSTLAQMACNLLKPDSGHILFKGLPVAKIPGHEFFKKISIVFQFPEKQIFHETVYQEIAYGLHNSGLSPDEISERINMYIRKLGLDPKVLCMPPLFLSGGEMRKVALASSFVLQPELLILDEPFSWLDEEGSEKLKDLIEERRAGGGSFIIISHDIFDLEAICSRIWHMEAGRLKGDVCRVN